MPFDLAKYKSAEIIDEPSKIESALMDADKTFKKLAGDDPSLLTSTTIKHNDDGDPVVMKNDSHSCIAKGAVKKSVSSTYRVSAENVGIKWKDGYDDRVIPFWASDDRVDRHGDRVEQTWNFKSYEKNPLFLHGHAWEAPPIGLAIKWGVEKRADTDYSGDALQLHCLYMDHDTYPFADTIFRMADGGFLKSGSPGFFPAQIINLKDPAERKALGMGPTGLIMRENRLIEFSQVSVPANPAAQRVAKHMMRDGVLKAADIQVFRELRRKDWNSAGVSSKVWSEADKEFLAFWKTLFPNVRVKEHGDIDKPLILRDIETKNLSKFISKAAVGAKKIVPDANAGETNEPNEGSPAEEMADSAEREIDPNVAQAHGSYYNSSPLSVQDTKGLLNKHGIQHDVHASGHSARFAVADHGANGMANAKHMHDKLTSGGYQHVGHAAQPYSDGSTQHTNFYEKGSKGIAVNATDNATGSSCATGYCYDTRHSSMEAAVKAMEAGAVMKALIQKGKKPQETIISGTQTEDGDDDASEDGEELEDADTSDNVLPPEDEGEETDEELEEEEETPNDNVAEQVKNLTKQVSGLTRIVEKLAALPQKGGDQNLAEGQPRKGLRSNRHAALATILRSA